MLKVAVNPRDVVSVPSDAGGEKVRVCRYEVLEDKVTAESERAVERRPVGVTIKGETVYAGDPCPFCRDEGGDGVVSEDGVCSVRNVRIAW